MSWRRHEVVESLSYSAERMTQVWPSRFASIASAAPYARNPRALADKVYNGRMGNRLGSDDGYNFRGQGFSQTTGRDEYQRLGKLTGLDLINHPEILIDPIHFLESGVANFPVWLPSVRESGRSAERHQTAERRHRRSRSAPAMAGEVEGRARIDPDHAGAGRPAGDPADRAAAAAARHSETGGARRATVSHQPCQGLHRRVHRVNSRCNLQKEKADTMVTFVSVFSFAAGGVLVWFAKDKIQALVIGGNVLAAKLKAQAAALEAEAAAIKAAL
jgi:hypothetical protein